MDINSHHHNLFGNQNFVQIGGFLYFGSHFGFKNGRHSKLMMDIKSQHHNLLGNQISSKSEDFCALVAILGHCHGNQGEKKFKIHSVQRILLKVDTKINHHSKLCTLFLKFSKWPGYHGNGRHLDFFQSRKSCHTQWWIFLQNCMKFDERNPTNS
jgi:hypothetical protein